MTLEQHDHGNLYSLLPMKEEGLPTDRKSFSAEARYNADQGHHAKLRKPRTYLGFLLAFSLLIATVYGVFKKSNVSSINWISTKTANVQSQDDVDFLCATRRMKRWTGSSDSSPRKVYDLFLIDTELDWLEIRMAELYDVVDYFVVIESDITMSGNPKPLFLQDNWDRFARWHSKMRRFTLDMTNFTKESGSWDREHHARNSLLTQGLRGLEGSDKPVKGDVLLVSDIDEVPRSSVVQSLRLCDMPKIVTLESDFYYYSFQWKNRLEWLHPQATTYDGLNTNGFEKLRMGDKGFRIKKAAWHCSNCFHSANQMVHKLESYPHTEVNKASLKAQDWIVHSYRYGIDIYNRTTEHYDRIDNNEDIPLVVRSNPIRYDHLLSRDPKNANFDDIV